MKKTIETDITKKIIAWLNKQPGCHVTKRLAGLTNAGDPDVTGTQTIELATGFKIGVQIEIESKRQGETPRPLQELVMARYKEMGVICFWCDSLDLCMKLYTEHIETIRRNLK